MRMCFFLIREKQIKYFPVNFWLALSDGNKIIYMSSIKIFNKSITFEEVIMIYEQIIRSYTILQ